MRLRIRTVLRYPWPDSWGAFSGRSGFCFRASAIAVIFLVFCFQRLVREFSPDVSANTLFRTYVYVWDKNFKLCGAADSGSDLRSATDCALSTVSRVCLLRAQIATTQQKIEMRCISESQPPPLPSFSSLSSLFVRARAFARTCICTPKPSCK